MSTIPPKFFEKNNSLNVIEFVFENEEELRETRLKIRKIIEKFYETLNEFDFEAILKANVIVDQARKKAFLILSGNEAAICSLGLILNEDWGSDFVF